MIMQKMLMRIFMHYGLRCAGKPSYRGCHESTVPDAVVQKTLVNLHHKKHKHFTK